VEINRITRNRIRKLFLKSDSLSKITRVRYNGLSKIDRRIEKHLDFNNGFFVELGANDGIAQSNSLYFERYKNWSGILIEPNYENYIKCVTNRGSRNRVFQAACVSSAYDKEKVSLSFANLMTVMREGSTDNTNIDLHLQNAKKFLNGQEIYEFEAPAKTLQAIFEESNAPYLMDLLSLDVEGAELEVLKGVNHREYRFKVICVEARNFYEMNNFLTKQEYKFLEQISTHDYLFANNK
jgi:FkbM family methyltransferase